MDFFSTFKKNFEQQASKARVFAQNVSGKAQDFAQAAKANALVLAEKLKEDAKGLTDQSQWQEAAEKAKQNLLGFSLLSPTEEADLSHELEAFGISESYKEFVRQLDYSTFRDFDEEELQSTVGFLDDGHGLRLNPWQERHALLALRSCQELDHLRYLLCPKRMTEEKFWLVYFSLAQLHLPEGCRTGEMPDLKQPSAPMTPIEQSSTESEEADGDEEDDLDKYLKDVLEDDAEESTTQDDGFEDLDEYMERLNAEMDSQKEVSVASDAIESLDASSKEDKEDALPGEKGEGFLVDAPSEGKENEIDNPSEDVK